MTCSDNSNCLVCDSNYVRSASAPYVCSCNSLSTYNNSVCTECSLLLLNCINCNDNVTCTTCINLYTPINGICVICSSISTIGPCLDCSQSNFCTICINNTYYPDILGICKICSFYLNQCEECLN